MLQNAVLKALFQLNLNNFYSLEINLPKFVKVEEEKVIIKKRSNVLILILSELFVLLEYLELFKKLHHILISIEII